MNMRIFTIAVFSLLFIGTAFAEKPIPNSKDRQQFLMDCGAPSAQIDLRVNNVRARLKIGGDLWSSSQYVVPQSPDLPTFEVAALNAGGIWTGGTDPGGNLKLAAQRYGSINGRTDFFAGPLNQTDGTTDFDNCINWDRFFKVTRTELEEHFNLLESGNYQADQIPFGIKGWAASGNPHFFDIYQFELPNGQGLAGFFDANGNGIYDPLNGDFPTLEISGCGGGDKASYIRSFPDEMIFWIFNDAGNIHSETGGDVLKLESQVTAFAYKTDDAVNDATFYRYKNLYRGLEDLNNFYFGLWVDPDLGCFTDDLCGVDSTRSLSYIYNEDAEDGAVGCTCPAGVNTYCSSVPVVGIDVFRGVDNGGMSSFSYYNGNDFGGAFGMRGPQTPSEYFNYLSGNWRDGSSMEYGGNGYNSGGKTTNFAFSSPPDCSDANCWSMCTSNFTQQDFRMVHSSGGETMAPGSITEFIFGVIWAPNIAHPCPDLTAFFDADDLAQAAFDNCFEIKGDLSSTGNVLVENQIRVYPNPGNVFEGVSISNVPNSAGVKIFDSTGKLIMSFDKENVSSNLKSTIFWKPETGLLAGSYLIRIETKDDEVLTFKWNSF